jgi:ribosomal protein L40E
MSPTLEHRLCPDCGATFYLVSQDSELPPHGCRGPSPQPPDLAQAESPPEAPAPEPTRDAEPAAAASEPEPATPTDQGSLFDSLQDQVREQQPAAPTPQSGAARGELKEQTARYLRERGYVLDEDAHGLRISGNPSGGASGSTLSPLDIVRMAAELDGGVKQATSLQTCPKCQARTPAGQAKCQWCGEPFPRTDATG